MKQTLKSTNGTSFHDITITTTVNELVRVLGYPGEDNNTGEDKVNFEWECETKGGYVVTIYDWKEYRELDFNEKIEFHIGGKNRFETYEAKDELLKLLNK
jgi:hypothetical protein